VRLNADQIPTRTGKLWHGIVENRILTGERAITGRRRLDISSRTRRASNDRSNHIWPEMLHIRRKAPPRSKNVLQRPRDYINVDLRLPTLALNLVGFALRRAQIYRTSPRGA
jgi:hypothetical protein